ncbi:MAG: hypothetical protein ACXVLQ_09790 [Bacteriovorax sp.]
MKKVMILPLLFLAFLYSSLTNSANAYLILTYKSKEIDFSRPTHLLVTGTGKEQETQFQEVANSKALKYSQLYPNEQIVLIAKHETQTADDNKQFLQNLGFKLQKDVPSIFDGNALVMELLKFQRISSVDIFSHGTALYGLYLENYKRRFSLESKGIENLRNHFLPDAYFIMHGCNAGYFASALSNALEIPVAAALTSTDFQRLHSNGDFYVANKGYFPNGLWAKENNYSFDLRTSCQNGKCLRLKPDNHTYVGLWGEYEGGGLPFYKFFCAKNETSTCEKIMAKSIYSFISKVSLSERSSFEDYRKVVIDFLCPISAKRDLRGECEKNLELALINKDETYNPFRGRLLNCNFQSCQGEFQCKNVAVSNIPNAKSCLLLNNSKRKATTLVREYKAYLEGYKLLHSIPGDLAL